MPSIADIAIHRVLRGLLFPTMLGLAAGLALPGMGLAQAGPDDPDNPDDPDTEQTRPRDRVGDPNDPLASDSDSTAVDAVMKAIRPTYATQYNVARQVTSWNQKLEFGGTYRFLDFKNTTDFGIRDDSGTNQEQRDGLNVTSLTWRLIPKLPVGMDVRLNRTLNDGLTLDREINQSTVDLNTRYSTGPGKARTTVIVQGGYDYRTDRSDSQDRSSESTESGFSGSGEWKGVWEPLPTLKLDSNYKKEEDRRTSELRDAIVDTTQEESTNRSASTFQFSANYEPTAWVTSRVDYRDVSDNDEYFDLQSGVGRLENKVSARKDFTANINLKPSDKFNLTWNLNAYESALSYQVRTERASDGEGTSWAGNLKAEVFGTAFDTRLSSQKDRLSPATTLSSDKELRVFEGKATRPLSEKFEGRMNWEVRVRQQFFDGPLEQRQDFDERKVKFDGGLVYDPNTRWLVNLAYAQENTRRVEVNTLRAASTQEEENFTVTVGINYFLSAMTSIRQNYSIQAAYTTFDFNPGNNRLRSTQRINTSLLSRITPKVELSLTHDFSLIDSGPFRFDATGTRIFSRSKRDYTQVLTSEIEYAVTSWLTLTAFERFRRTDGVEEASGSRLTRRNLELREGFQVQRALGAGFRVDASGNYVRSNNTQSYWSLNSSLTKEF